MKTREFGKVDLLVLLFSVFFFLGCLATAHRPARVVKPGQVSGGANYLHAINLEETEAKPVRLLSLDLRTGLFKNVDFGLMHTWDLSEDNDKMFSTVWGDLKIQLLNSKNLMNRPTLALGYGVGYVYHKDVELYITSLLMVASIQLNQYSTPYFCYRMEYIDDRFFPEKFEDPRIVFSIGSEISLGSDPSKVMPKLALELGIFNSLTGGEGDNGLILNFGLNFYSPTNK